MLTSRHWMHAALVAVVIASAGCGNPFGKVYEYEEDLYIALDGSANLIVNASIPALVALRGLDFDLDPRSQVDREKLRATYESPITEPRVRRPWRRSGRRFVQIRMAVKDVRRLSEVAPLSWSKYALVEQNGEVVFTQNVGPSAFKRGTLQNVGWSGGELVAFRLHLPSRIVWHNARDVDTNETSGVQRGNILAWEQPLSDRLDGQPVAIEVRMDKQSILHRTLWLFAGSFAAAVAVLLLGVWLALRKGAKEQP